ncbi:MAG: hypothetical protein AB1488_00115 [Nitrospirota bacterium]
MNKNGSAIAWVLQRLTGVGLIFLLGVHFWLLHYKTLGEVVKFSDVAIRLRTLTFIFVDIGILIFGLFHALNGVNNIAQDYGVRAVGRRGIGWILAIVGCVMAVLGGISIFSFLYVTM